MAKVPSRVETLPKMSIVWVHTTDDRQTTDRRTGDDIEREREFTFAKNAENVN